MEPVLDDVGGALDRLAAAELSDSESIEELHRLLNRLEAIATLAVGRWDALGEWKVSSAKDAAAWLATRCRVSKRSTQQRVRLAREVRHLTEVEAAWIHGQINAEHVAALVRARNPHTAAAMSRDEGLLVDLARTLRFSHFQRKLAYWKERVDPDGADRDGRRLVEDRRFDVSTTFQGRVVGDFVLDPLGGAVVVNELRHIERQMFEADWADAKERLGREPLPAELRRTPKQRRADALVEMAIRSATPNKKGDRPRPLFSVFVNHDTIHELADGTVITPGSLLPWFPLADLKRVVFESPSRVLDVGETQRFFRGATRDSVMYVGRECADGYCEERLRLQADHVEPHSWGGPTTQVNGRPLCGWHNRRR